MQFALIYLLISAPLQLPTKRVAIKILAKQLQLETRSEFIIFATKY